MSVQASERLFGKLEPTKNGSTYIDPKTMEWEKSQFEKIWKKVLYQNKATGAITYSIANSKDRYVDALLGVRAIDATATLSLNVAGTPEKASVSKKTSTVDPIFGTKGRYQLADSSWYVPFYADIGSGGGTTNLTWQAMLGVGKTFNRVVDVSLAYRTLYYDMKTGGVLQKTTMSGPVLAATIKF
jgi:hypothetical protein